MRGRLLAWPVLAMLCVGWCLSLCDALLWAQEGALDQAEQLTEQRQRAARGSRPSREPVTVQEAQEQPSHRWGNMNWFALYLVLAGPTTYFVFRGAGR